MKGIPCSFEEQQIMINAYLSGKSLKESASIVNRNERSCRNTLKAYGKLSRSKDIAHRVHIINNESFFSNINTEEKAYWLGFLAADGNIYNHKISLGLKEEDESHLQKFKLALGVSYPITKKKNKPFYTIQISSKKMASDLFSTETLFKPMQLIIKSIFPIFFIIFFMSVDTEITDSFKSLFFLEAP